MLFEKLPLEGALRISMQTHSDERGSFARNFCKNAFLENGLDFAILQTNLSFNKKKGTLRGMHYQIEPHAEIKIIRCIRGAMDDVIVDIRPDSPTFGQWLKIRLSESDPYSLFVPQGFAHGFQTLCDNTEVLYYMSTLYQPDAARGIRWDDPTLNIEWPEENQRIISERDQNHPFFNGMITKHVGN
jgi:dTDP-4-dehydrorhamnose 3,5-epimerase